MPAGHRYTLDNHAKKASVLLILHTFILSSICGIVLVYLITLAPVQYKLALLISLSILGLFVGGMVSYIPILLITNPDKLVGYKAFGFLRNQGLKIRWVIVFVLIIIVGIIQTYTPKTGNELPIQTIFDIISFGSITFIIFTSSFLVADITDKCNMKNRILGKKPK